MRGDRAESIIRQIVSLFLVALLAFGAGGCASGSLSGLLKSSGPRPTDSDAARRATQPSPVTFAPIIGAPAGISKQLTGQLKSAAQSRDIPVVSGRSAAYTVRGYLATSPDRRGSKLAYIWDVTDKAGKRVHRITGEEIVPAKSGADPWSGVSQSALRNIASKTASGLASWLPRKPVSSTSLSPASRTGTPPRRTTVASRSRETMTQVPTVTGAPGDGAKSLTLAIKKQLFKKGRKLTSTSGPNVYSIQGSVKMGQPAAGKQSVRIDWQVIDPNGARLGTVTQENSVPQGSLDGPWGKIADVAAEAAAVRVIELLPKR